VILFCKSLSKLEKLLRQTILKIDRNEYRPIKTTKTINEGKKTETTVKTISEGKILLRKQCFGSGSTFNYHLDPDGLERAKRNFKKRNAAK
jgi:hypothetical protein